MSYDENNNLGEEEFDGEFDGKEEKEPNMDDLDSGDDFGFGNENEEEAY